MISTELLRHFFFLLDELSLLRIQLPMSSTLNGTHPQTYSIKLTAYSEKTVTYASTNRHHARRKLITDYPNNKTRRKYNLARIKGLKQANKKEVTRKGPQVLSRDDRRLRKRHVAIHVRRPPHLYLYFRSCFIYFI